MSHIVTIKTEVRDAAAVRAACQRLRLPAPVDGTHQLYSSQATGLGVQLPDWSYPAVCQLDSGEVRYDNFNGHWGEQSRLNQFLQAHAVDKAKVEARKKGHSVSETRRQDGSIRVTVRVGSAA